MFGTDEWVTISSLATAAGTLVLAVATFASVRSANHAARVAERSFRLALRPVLAPSRLEDPEERIMFGDRHWVVVPGGQASVEVVEGVARGVQVAQVGEQPSAEDGVDRRVRQGQPIHVAQHEAGQRPA